MNLEKLKQLALLEQIGGPQQQPEDQSRMAMGLIQALMQQQEGKARLGVQQQGVDLQRENMQGDRQHQTAMEALQRLQLTQQEKQNEDANARAGAAQSNAAAEFAVQQAQRQAMQDKALEQLAAESSANAAKLATEMTAKREALGAGLFSDAVRNNMNPIEALKLAGVFSPELGAKGTEMHQANVANEAAKYIALTSAYPPAIRQQVLDSAVAGGMNPATRALIDKHFGNNSVGTTTASSEPGFFKRNFGPLMNGMAGGVGTAPTAPATPELFGPPMPGTMDINNPGYKGGIDWNRLGEIFSKLIPVPMNDQQRLQAAQQRK